MPATVFAKMGRMSLPGRFNPFQRTMLLWDEMHVYNAIHAARFNTSFDAVRLKSALARVLEERGLTGFCMDDSRTRFSFEGGVANVDLTIRSVRNPGEDTLRDEIERQINLRFKPTGFSTPFRFFTVQEGAGFWLGIVYFHAVADAESVVRLAAEIASAYSGAPAGTAGGKWPVSHRAESRWRLGRFFRKILALPVQFRAMRRAIRPGSTGDGFENGTELFALDSSDLAALIAASKRIGVTVNDLLLALLMRSLAPLAGLRSRPRRNWISLGCIVNARRDLGMPEGDNFGLELGTFTVSAEIDATGNLRDLARAIAAQARRFKRGGLHLACDWEMRLVLRLMSFFSTNQRRRFYSKNYPLWGGLTNMNLKSLPVHPMANPLDYIRVVSTGPVTPLVLSVTTFACRVNCSLSYRTSVFSKAEMGAVRDGFIDGVRSVEAMR